MDKKAFLKGVRDGLPVCFVYVAVSFTFGLQAVQKGINAFFATVISATNLTSAGQFAGIQMIEHGESVLAVFIAVLIINARYLLMSFSLSQRLPENTGTGKRLIMSVFVTDELYALSCKEKEKFGFSYFFGSGIIAYIGWTLGTLLGSLTNDFLPLRVQVAMGIALYCMFIAIIIPPARENKKIFLTIFTASGLSCLFYLIPFFKKNFGLSVILASVVSACISAIFFPIKEEEYA